MQWEKAVAPKRSSPSGNVTPANIMLFWKAVSPILLIPAGMFTDSSFEHLSNIASSIVVRPSGSTASFRPVQLEKQPSRVVTELGISTLSSFSQYENAELLIVSSPSLNFTVSSLPHMKNAAWLISLRLAGHSRLFIGAPLNASAPMVRMPSGRFIPLRLVPENASSGMAVHPSGSVTDVSLPQPENTPSAGMMPSGNVNDVIAVSANA